VVIITTIFSLRLFDQVFILTKGGPIDATQTVMFQAVTSAFVEGNVGRASAITVIFVLIIIFITLIQRVVLKQNREVK
jgi:multiple sugar transport system permease protein